MLTFITRISTFEHSVLFLSLFLFLVFICDSLAWLFGVLFGKNNRGYVAASPNKSIVGFIGGYIGSIGSALLARCIWPEIFYGSFVKSIFLGILVASSVRIKWQQKYFSRNHKCHIKKQKHLF